MIAFLAGLALHNAGTPDAKADRQALRVALIECVRDQSVNYVLTAHAPADTAISAAFGKCSKEDAALHSAYLEAATIEGGQLWTIEQAETLMANARRGLRDKILSVILDAQSGAPE